MANIVEDYKKLNEDLDKVLQREFGRTDRNNIDVRNANPALMLNTIAILNLAYKIEELLEAVKKEQPKDKPTKTTKK